MRTATKLGLADHGQPVTAEELDNADYEAGYKNEVIDGRLYVSPEVSAPENWLETWLYKKLCKYADRRPDVINYVSNKSRVFVSSRKHLTVPEPDLAAFSDYPVDQSIELLDWESVSPVLVVEIHYAGDPYKDLVRNVELFLQVPSIREYWILDGRRGADKLGLIVRRRRGSQWSKREFEYREVYQTKLLPGFKLRIDSRR